MAYKGDNANPLPWLASINNLSIGKRLSFILGILILLTMIMGATSVATIQSLSNNELAVIEESRQVYDGLMNMRRQEKDFLLRDTISDSFYSTGQSGSLQVFYDWHEKTSVHVKNLKSFESSNGNQEGISRATRIESALSDYRTKFLQLAEKIRQRGFNSMGIIGELGKTLEDAEANLGSSNQALQLKILEAKLIEEQYISQKEEQQAQQIEAKLVSLENEIIDSQLGPEISEKALESLKSHREKFLEMVALDHEIGVKFNEGLQGQMVSRAGEVERLVNAETDSVRESISAKTSAMVAKIVALLLLIILFSALAGYFLTISIAMPIRKLTDAAEEMSKGNLDAKIDDKLKDSKDELGALARAFNRTAVSLKITLAAKKDEKKVERELREAMERQQ